MGRITKTLLAASLAVGGMFAAASPAQATGSLVDVKIGDIVLHNSIPVDVAALVCGIVDLNALVADLNEGDNEADCLLIDGAKIIKK